MWTRSVSVRVRWRSAVAVFLLLSSVAKANVLQGGMQLSLHYLRGADALLLHDETIYATRRHLFQDNASSSASTLDKPSDTSNNNGIATFENTSQQDLNSNSKQLEQHDDSNNGNQQISSKNSNQQSNNVQGGINNNNNQQSNNNRPKLGGGNSNQPVGGNNNRPGPVNSNGPGSDSSVLGGGNNNNQASNQQPGNQQSNNVQGNSNNINNQQSNNVQGNSNNINNQQSNNDQGNSNNINNQQANKPGSGSIDQQGSSVLDNHNNNDQASDQQSSNQQSNNVVNGILNNNMQGNNLLGGGVFQQDGNNTNSTQGGDDYNPDDYYCGAPGYNCYYYDYGVNIEGTGSLGVLENVLLNQINNLANLTPRLASRARADTAVTGSQTASRRNTTAVVQNLPSRTAGLYLTGGVGLDPVNTAALSAGTSTAVAKNIVSIGFPVNNYGSSGETFIVVNSSSNVPGRTAGSRSLSGGLATAGDRAIATTTGTFSVGPVIGIFNAGNRVGSASQNGAFSQSVGQSSSSYLQSSSLAVVSPGNQALLRNLMNQAKNANATINKQGQPGAGMLQPDNQGIVQADQQDIMQQRQEGMMQQARQGTLPQDQQDMRPGGVSQQPGKDYNNNVTNGNIPFQDYYYYDEAHGSQPQQTNAGGAVGKAWIQHQDLTSVPSTRQFNTRAQINTFGAANGFGWARGVSQNELTATSTRSAAVRLRTGAFGTGGSTLTGSVGAVTDLPNLIQCKKGRIDGQGGTTNNISDCNPIQDNNQQQPGLGNQQGQPNQQNLSSAGNLGNPAASSNNDQALNGPAGGTGSIQARAAMIADVNAPPSPPPFAPLPADPPVDQDGDLLTPELSAALDGNMFMGSKAAPST